MNRRPAPSWTRLCRRALGALAAFGLCGLVLTGCTAHPPGAVELRVLAFNDFHGHLEPGSNALTLRDPDDPSRTVRVATGGAAALAGTIAAERAGARHHLVVSAGDLIGASPLVSSLFRDEPTIEVMNALGLAINAVGNHEFDQGLAELRRQVDGGCAPPRGDGFAVSCADAQRPYTGARFAPGAGRGFLAANVVDPAGRPVLPAHAIHRFEGVPVAFVGVVTRSTPTVVSPSGIRGLRFLDEAETLNRVAAELEGQGVRALIAVVHEGGEIRGDWNDPTCPGARGPIFEIERRLSPAYAVVISGHTHQGYACRIGGPQGRIVSQAFSFGRGLTRLDLAIDRASGRIDLARSAVRNLPVVHGGNPPEVLRRFPAATPDAAVQAQVDAAAVRAAPIAARPLGRLAEPITRLPDATGGGDHPAGRLVADAQLAATRSPDTGGAQIALMNPGGIRADFTCRPAPCTLTFGEAFTVQPFGNALVVMSLTGAELDAVLEQQATGVNAERPRMLQPSRGFSYRWTASAPPGQRASELTLDGRAIRPDETVRVVVNSFLAEGGDGFDGLRGGRDRLGGPLDIEAFAAFMARQTAPVPAPAGPRIQRGDPSPGGG